MRLTLHKAAFPRSEAEVWSGIFVVHTWPDLTVTASDNGGIGYVAFYLADKNETRESVPNAAGEAFGTYRATFEIDFWSDYTWGYQAGGTVLFEMDNTGSTTKYVYAAGLRVEWTGHANEGDPPEWMPSYPSPRILLA